MTANASTFLQALVTVTHTDMAVVYAKKLQEFLSRFYDEELFICSTLLALMAGQIYGGVSTEQLGRMLSQHVCPPQLETAPTFRLLQVMREFVLGAWNLVLCYFS